MSALSIRTKLFIAFLLACLLSLGAVLLVFKYTVTDAFLNYINQQDKEQLDRLEKSLLDYYSTQLTWDDLKGNTRALSPFMFRPERGRPPPQRPNIKWGLPHPPHDAHHNNLTPPPPGPGGRQGRLIERTVLLDQQRQVIWRWRDGTQIHEHERTLRYNGEVVGYLGIFTNNGVSDQLDKEFAHQIDYLLWLSAIAALVTTALFSFLLARQLVKPIQQLRHATALLTEGKYGHHMPPPTQDELGKLVGDFNQLSQRLKENEGARKQWIMDIAHELRTPLAILRGEIEAIQDGINLPDEDTINSLHQEVLHLNRLVDDLYTLSMSDSGALSYHKKPIDLSSLLKDSLVQFAKPLQTQDIALTVSLPARPIMIQGDEQRLQQLFQNLLKNTLRYTDAPGKLQVALKTQAQQAIITFNDSAPGVPTESLPKLFDRLYRVEASRNRASGGAGIGLTISYNIVHAHHGQIKANHSPLGGLGIVITLPLLN